MTPIQCLNYPELGLNPQESQSGTSTSCWWQAITRGILDFSCCRPTGSKHDRELADPERHEHTLGDKDGALKELKVEGVRQVLPKCTYLQDGMIFFMFCLQDVVCCIQFSIDFKQNSDHSRMNPWKWKVADLSVWNEVILDRLVFGSIF